MRLRVALLNASYDPVDTRRNFRREVDADLVEYHVVEGEFPETFAFDACLMTGSRASVYWDDPWIGELAEWVGGAIDRGLPALGVCFGHQLLADVLGGQVEPMGEYELGYRPVQCREGSTLFAGIGSECTAFMTHSDHVTQLPPGATLLAANDYGIHGFRKAGVFGVQFHPEYDTDTAAKITRGKETLSEERRARVLADIDAGTYAAACETKALFDNFTGYVRRQQSPRSAADD